LAGLASGVAIVAIMEDEDPKAREILDGIARKAFPGPPADGVNPRSRG
jgi:hypothetical protein